MDYLLGVRDYGRHLELLPNLRLTTPYEEVLE